ncbi:hypothetical protein, partial [Streptomyces sp. wa1063]
MSITTTNTDASTTAPDAAVLPTQARGGSPSGLAAEARATALLDAGAILPAGTTDRDDADA